MIVHRTWLRIVWPVLVLLAVLTAVVLAGGVLPRAVGERGDVPDLARPLIVPHGTGCPGDASFRA